MSETISTQSGIDAVADYRGTFKQGTLAALQIRISDFEANPVDPDSITITIKDDDGNIVESSGTEVDAIAPEKVADGFYVYDWIIDTDETVGPHAVTWVHFIGGERAEELQEIVVADSQTPSAFYSGPKFILRESLRQLIYCAQSIPVYQEQARPNKDLQKFEFTKDKWNQTPGVKIYRNQEIVDSGIEVNYFNGTVNFDDTLLRQDVIAADYTFRWYEDQQLDQFIENGIHMLNAYPPFRPAFNHSTLVTQGTQHIPAVLYGASIDALRTLMLCLQFQEPAQFFGGLDRAQSVFGNLESLKRNYESMWEKLLGQKKFGPYPTTKLVVVPEFTLPGGRCMRAISILKARIDNSIVDMDLEEVHRVYNSGRKVFVQSNPDKTSDAVFAHVSYVWPTGEKRACRISTKDGHVLECSDEHLVFINGGYKPAFQVKIGDTLVCEDDNNIYPDTVKRINISRTALPMYDLEVLPTANLFANGVKCHNSRWFRYLFSSGSG